MYQETSLKTDRMIYANTRSDEADMDYRMHCHNSYEIYYIITGNVEYLLEGHVPYAFRTTVVREFHQKSDFEEMGRWIRGAATYYIQQFENSGGLIREGLHAYDEPVLLQVKAIMENYVGEVEIRGI